MNTPMNHGFVLMHRGWLDHPVLAETAYCKRAAWASLIESASHKNWKGLKRGQLRVSYASLARHWGWSKSRVHRFMNALRKQDMIRIETRNRKSSIVTLCNYDKYQCPGKSNPADIETHLKTLIGHDRNRSETPYNTLNQNQETKTIDLEDRQILEELFVILNGCAVDPHSSPQLYDASEPRRWKAQYSWNRFVVPTIRKWAAKDRAKATKTTIRSWTYFSRMLENEFEKQRKSLL